MIENGVLIGLNDIKIHDGEICAQFDSDEPFVIGSFDKTKNAEITWNPSHGGSLVFTDPVSGKTMKVFGRAKR